MRSTTQPVVSSAFASLMTQADSNPSALDLFNAHLNAEFPVDEKVQQQFRNEKEFPDTRLQTMLDRHIPTLPDQTKWQKQQMHAKQELARRRQQKSSAWKHEVRLSTVSSESYRMFLHSTC